MRQFVSILCFFLVTGFGLYWQYKNNHLLDKEHRYYLSELAQSEAIAIERRISNALSATNILALEIKQNKGYFFGFELYANEVINSIDGISNLQLAPNGIITKIYPLEGNEKAIGHNILTDEKRKHETRLAIEEKKLTLAGPFELVQGGVAVIGRNPVFIQENEKDVFWGLVSVMIHVDDLLAATTLSKLNERNHAYQLSRINPDTKQEEIIVRSSLDITKHSTTKKINLPNAVWSLTISSSNTERNEDSTYLASIFLGLLAALAIGYLFLKPEHLIKIVNEKTKELEKLAFKDHLTSLGNRRLLASELHKLLQKKNKPVAALLYLDLDDFKRINDSLGHSSGDYLLKKVASRLTNIVKRKDIVARLGGDEFALLIFDIESKDTIERLAQRIITETKKPVIFGDRSLIISASLGITLIPNDGDNEETLLRNVDIAMYDAKNNGKNSYRFFDKKLQLDALEKHQIELSLTNVTKRDELFLHYQPLTCLKEREVIAYEVLLRWRHPEKGLLSPDQFIPVAEATGQIIPIGYWVFEQACKAIKQCEIEHKQPLHTCVNLSPKQFLDPYLLQNLTAIIEEQEINPTHLEIEITESSLTLDMENAIVILTKLRSIGIKVAIDDFGTGYSSLSQLKNFPVDRLKIDRSFITNISTDESDQKLVKAIIAMSHALEIDVVTEGIETQEQLDWLANNGCDVGQGYFLARPALLETFL